MNTTNLRDALTTLGISAATPGVRGDDRRAILLARYEEATGTTTSQVMGKAPSTNQSVAGADAMNMADLRRELEQVGISTNTPGLRGDERRAELILRLQQHRTGGTSLAGSVPRGKASDAWQCSKPAENEDNQVSPTTNDRSQPRVAPRSGKLADSTGDDEDQVGVSTSPMKRSQQQKSQASRIKAEIQSIQKARSSAIAAALGQDTVAFYTQKLLDIDHHKTEGGDTITRAAMDELLALETEMHEKLNAANDKELRVRELERLHPDHGVHVEHEKMQMLRGLQDDIARQGLQGFKDLVRIASQDDQPTPQHLSKPPPSPGKSAKAAHTRVNPLLGATMTTLDDLRRQTLPPAVLPATQRTFDPLEYRDRVATFHGASVVPTAPESQTRADKLGRKAFFLHKIKGDFVQAEAAYTQAIDANPTHGVNLGHFALFLDHVVHRVDDAEEFYLRAIDATADNALHLSHYANFLQRVRGDTNRAEAYYVRCMADFPLHASNLGNYANFQRYAKDDLANAEATFVKALKVDPTHVNNLSQYASLLSEMGKLEHADAMYQKAMHMDKDNVTICGNYANLLVKRHKLSAAKELYLKAMALDRENLHAQQNYALFLRDHPSMRTGETRPIKMHPRDRWVQLKQDTSLLVKASTAFRIK
ncbi:hypothetical protein, variant [Aphanomyces astaci]|uniref:Uncharacterized protein n=1 Tax=Aphanomyces astaci TaxID=112090 RepID=W4H936_APHAT|nr:hypothetical protein, variant [Aphanomyces astaci]ETV88056.1 hypothetical protein, variant [Aphanomyces astaci]|eukprot:XP_009822919.1 hypothetical protein, variant [Aphanomyces astaci]